MQSVCVILEMRLWPLGLHHIFRHYLINSELFEKKVIEHKTRVFILSTTFVENISHSKKNFARYCPKCLNVFM